MVVCYVGGPTNEPIIHPSYERFEKYYLFSSLKIRCRLKPYVYTYMGDAQKKEINSVAFLRLYL